MRLIFFLVICLAAAGLTFHYFSGRSTSDLKSQNIASQMPSSSSSPQTLIPRSVIFGNPDRAGVKLSPDGKKISYLASLDGVLNVFVGDAASDVGANPITKSTERGITSYFWANDGEHIVYFMDSGGDENHGLYVVNVNTGQVVSSIAIANVKVSLIGKSHIFPTMILVCTNERRADFFDVYSFDIVTGNRKMVYQNEKYINFVPDSFLNLRLAARYNDKRELLFEKLDENGEDAGEFIKFGQEDADTSSIIAFNEAGDEVYLSDSTGRNTSALYTMNFNDLSRKSLYSHDLTDSLSLMLHPTKKTVQSVIHEYAKPQYHFFDSAIEKDIRFIENKLQTHVQIASRSIKDDVWVIAALFDDAPHEYYLYRRSTAACLGQVEEWHEGSLVHLFSSKRKLSDYQLNKMHPVEIKARDGLVLMSYLTLPSEVKAEFSIDKSTGVETLHSVNKKVPTVLLVHGGPTARDDWGLDAQHQWLSNRGYAVLSVNYRGSTGFGKDFIRAGDGEWGGKMHDDLVDAVSWGESIFADKTAIMGGSYGGYAALLGVTITPELFVCGVDIVGPSNLATLLETIPPYWAPLKVSLIKKIGGSPDTEEGRAFLANRSPITHIEKIKRPLLIAQGANDPRVKQSESEQIVDAMRKRNIPVTYLLYPDEGHGFNRPENKMSFFRVAEKFLANAFNKRDAFEDSDDAAGASMKIVHGQEFLNIDS